jgi:dihydroorotate dehydrogenase (NAD+) catalytic subunit
MKKTKVHRATVIECRPERKGSEAILLKLKLDENENFTAGAGQFIVLPPREKTSVMPRPFTIVDFKNSELSILFRIAGKNTQGYAQLKKGERIEVFGPQGTEIKFDFKKRNCIFVAGGIGGAALIMPIKKALAGGKNITVMLGAKNKSQLAGLSFFTQLGIKANIITENDPGKTGPVTELLEKALKNDAGLSEVIACGPKAMLYKVARLCKKHGNRCLVITEEIMACGMGACKGCAIFGGRGGRKVKHVCSDGPTFNAKWIYWPKFIPVPLKQERKKKPAEKEIQLDFTCHLGPLTLKYPIMNCSGTLDIDACENGDVDTGMLGALVTKGLSLYERAGNPMPRVCETPSGMLNAIGLEYIGLGRFLEEALPRLLKFRIPIIVNINGINVQEYAQLAFKLNGTGIAAIEINISCPNVKEGGMLFGKDPGMAVEVVRAIRQATNLPLITKLTPNVTDIGEIARAVEWAGTDIISLVNTLEAAAIDIWTRKPKIGNLFAGLSGSAIKPIAIAKIIQVSRAVKIPIIGMGGNENGYTAAEMMMAGASATAFGTSGFAQRNIHTKAIRELAETALLHGFTATEQLVGSMVVGK